MADKTNYTRPEDKRVWGFEGSADKIELTDKKAGDSVKSVDSKKSETGRKQGGDGK